jgi:predicted aspartyl protease
MIHKVQLIDLGDEGAFLPLPNEALERMNAAPGGELVAVQTANGITLTMSSTRER